MTPDTRAFKSRIIDPINQIVYMRFENLERDAQKRLIVYMRFGAIDFRGSDTTKRGER